MRRFFVLALAAAACTETEDPPTADVAQALAEEPIDVFVIALQSNAVGGARVSELPPALGAYADPYPAVRQAYQLNCPKGGVDGPCIHVQGWSDLRPRGSQSLFGIELSAGRRLDERFGTVAILKTATSGTGVGAEWEPDATPGKWQWHYMLEFIDARMTELPATARIAGLMLVGCEGDAHDPRRASAIDGELAYFVMRFRREYGDVPVVIAELNAEHPYTADVRERQHRLADHIAGVTIVPTGDLVYRDEGVHYDARSFITLGTRMADAFPE